VWKDKLVKGETCMLQTLTVDGSMNDMDRPGVRIHFQLLCQPSNPDVCYTTDFGRVIKTEDWWEKLNAGIH
jgi:hypothetical protein